MKLNWVEKVLMNNPARAFLQRHVEARRFLGLEGIARNGRVLEIGCGRGVGVEILSDMAPTSSVDAFDLDPDMIVRARRRLARRRQDVRLWVGDASEIAAGNGWYDTVVDFGIIHHIPDWRRSLREVGRVLKPGGRFYAEELLRDAVLHPLCRGFVVHPTEDRFTFEDFRDYLVEAGLSVIVARPMTRYFAWFIAEKQVA